MNYCGKTLPITNWLPEMHKATISTGFTTASTKFNFTPKSEVIAEVSKLNAMRKNFPPEKLLILRFQKIPGFVLFRIVTKS